MSKRVLAVIVVALLGVLVGSCENVQDVFAVQKPKATLQGLQIEDVGLDSATLLFDVKLDNPYPVSLPLLNMDYAVASGANKLFTGEADIQTTIPAKESRTISLPAKVSYLDMVRAFKDIRPGSKIPYNADVGLSVDTPALGQLRLPLNKTGQLDVPSVPKIDDIDFRQLLDKASQL